MFIFRELLRHLKGSFEPSWSFRACCLLLLVLDVSGFMALMWYFFLRESNPLEPVFITIFASVYLFGVLVLFIISVFFGKLMSVRVATMFYFSVGGFLLATGIQQGKGLEFPVFPWIIIWCITLGILFQNVASEFASLKTKTPQD